MARRCPVRACHAGGMKSAAAEVLEILDQVLAIVQHVPQDLTDHAGRIRQGDLSRLPDLRFLFVATGPLCEIAASSGWLDTYAVLGNRFDELHKRLRQP